MSSFGNTYWNQDLKPTWGTFSSLEAWRTATGNEMLDGRSIGALQDPLLVDDPQGRLFTDPSKLHLLRSHMLKPQSPCIDQALDLKTLRGIDVGTEDLFGTVLPFGKTFDVGAHEWSKPTASPRPAR